MVCILSDKDNGLCLKSSHTKCEDCSHDCVTFVEERAYQCRKRFKKVNQEM
jgi:hypothetical protein